MSAALFACPVDREPSCPVFIACSMSSASAPRTSPTISLVGRMRRAVRIRSRMEMRPVPSRFSSRVSKRTRFGSPCSFSSSESSIVITRSSAGMNSDSAFRKVVLPEPVPPLMKMLQPVRTALLRNAAASGLTEPWAVSFSMVSGLR